MKLSFTTEITANGHYEIGDIISFTLNNGEEARAIAVKQEPSAMLFCFENCLLDYPMNLKNSNHGGYELSKLREILNDSKVLNLFPTEIGEKMTPFSNGDFLRLPSEREIFGRNYYGEKEDNSIEQWKPMKNLRNCIALSKSGACITWYWLSNAIIESASDFASVDDIGFANCRAASYSLGVRPVFSLITED